jgi:hypothetical protein
MIEVKHEATGDTLLQLDIDSLMGAHLAEADLQGAGLAAARLEGANLDGANLWGANLRGASLAGASLNDAYCGEANLEGANLEHAQLVRACLWGSNLTRATLIAMTSAIVRQLLQPLQDVVRPSLPCRLVQIFGRGDPCQQILQDLDRTLPVSLLPVAIGQRRVRAWHQRIPFSFQFHHTQRLTRPSNALQTPVRAPQPISGKFIAKSDTNLLCSVPAFLEHQVHDLLG